MGFYDGFLAPGRALSRWLVNAILGEELLQATMQAKYIILPVIYLHWAIFYFMPILCFYGAVMALGQIAGRK